IIQNVLTCEPAAPRSVRRDTPPELEAICLKCLDKDPAKRYHAAKELAEDLARWRNGESTVARPLKLRQRAWRRVKRGREAPGAAVVLLGCIGITYAVVRRDSQPPLPQAEKPSDPPIAQIEAALRRKEAVTLIGPGGRPKYQRWVVGTGEMSDAGPNQPALVQCS